MKVFYSLFVILLSISLVTNAQRTENFKVVKGNDVKQFELVSSNSKAPDTDTLFNIGATENLTIYGFTPPTWGTWSGHNEYLIDQYAEYFTNTLPGEVNGAIIYAYSAYSGGAGHSITVNVYADGATPGAVLGSKTVDISTLTPMNLNDITFDTPIAITGNFYIGYTINYVTPADTFSVVMAENRPTGPNTAFMHYNSSWVSVDALSGGGLLTSYAIMARCALTAPSAPTATLTPSAYDAGTLQIPNTATSGTFTLKNIGTGTLTITSVTDLSTTPWTTDLVPGSVNLTQNQTATFTFTYSPVAPGTDNVTFDIVTNGGTVSVALTGQAVTCSTINTFPWVESFEGGTFPPACWVTESPDGGTGWDVITDGTTPLPGWQGGTMTVPTGGGTQAAYCTWTTGGASANDQWLITPQIAVQANHGLMFQLFWFGAYYDVLDVKVSTTTNTAASFTTTLMTIDTTTLIHNAWNPILIDVSAYAGQNVYFAFNEHVADNFNDGAFFGLDLVTVDQMSGINQISQDLVSIFPNPANNNIHIAAKNLQSVEIYNMTGEMIAKSNLNIINVSELAQGAYIVKVITNTKVTTQKINVVH